MKSVPSVLIQLKNETAYMHHNLEKTIVSDDTTNIYNDIHQYARLISAHYHHHIAVSRQLKLAGFEAHTILDWPDCIRIPALLEDLKNLNIDINDTAEIPLTEGNKAFALGMCYVSEGSCHGNKLLLKRLDEDHGPSIYNALHFLTACSSNMESRWSTFTNLIVPYAEKDYKNVKSGCLYGYHIFELLWKTHYLFITP